MGNTFKVQIKKGGEFVPLGATAVFPFSFGELLDERLDEAYLTFYGSSEKNYPRLTEFKITFNEANGHSHDEYYILAGDNSSEYPAGSGRYKHQVYLIERTKLLDGVLCSSLTFTNSLNKIYTNNQEDAPPKSLSNYYFPGYSKPGPNHAWDGEIIQVYFNQSFFSTPISNEIPITIPSVDTVGEAIRDFFPEKSAPNKYLKTHPIYGSSSAWFLLDAIETENEIKGEYQIEATALNNKTLLTVNYYVIIETYDDDYTPNTSAYVVSYDIALIKNQYPIKRWTITDCINRVLDLAEPLFDGEMPRFKLDDAFAEKYDKVPAPEFTLTQDTLREQLKVIGGYIHAEPWLDENNFIHFKDLGITEVSSAESYGYITETAASHINEYCTEIRSNAQNLASSLGYAKGVTVEPATDLYRSLRSETMYARINEDTGEIVTDKPIYSIQKIICGFAKQKAISASSSVEHLTEWLTEPTVDITPYVFELAEYNANLSSYLGVYPYSKEYAIYYEIGKKNIKGLFYKVPNKKDNSLSKFAISNIFAAASGQTLANVDAAIVDDPYNLVFQITYKPISSHYISHGKQTYDPDEVPFQRSYNQSENMIESEFFGEHMKGVAARLGNVERERTFILRSLADVPKIGQMLDGYAISAVNVEYMPLHIKCTVGLSKDFNRISQYVGINSQKRMYEISERQTTQRDILLKETLVIGKLPDGYSNSGRMFNIISPIYNLFADANIIDIPVVSQVISAAAFCGLSRNKNPVSQDIILPVISRFLGNTLTFFFAPKDNYSAGTYAIWIEETNKPVDYGIKGRWLTDERYTDYHGRIYWIRFGLSSSIKTDNAAALVSQAFTFPKANEKVYETFRENVLVDGGLCDSSKALLLRKDNREIPSFNIELEIKTTERDIIIGSAMAEYCRLITDERAGDIRLVLLANPGAFGKFDKSYIPRENDVIADWELTEINEENQTFGFVPINLSQKNITGQYYGWVLITGEEVKTQKAVDEDGNIIDDVVYTGNKVLLASTKPFTGQDTIMKDLYFYIAK